jgi:outer membrane protein assembly factor BamB
MSRTAISFCSITVVLSLALSASAEQWIQFRGPAGNGHSTAKNLPAKWSKARNVAWKQEVPGEGWSSPVVADGRIYLTAAVPVTDGETQDYSLQLLTLDAKSGEALGSLEVFHQEGATAATIHNKNSHASPTPIIEGERIYVHFGHQGTACVSRDGKIVWQNRDLRYPPVHGNGGTPIIVDDALIFSCDAASDPFVVALNKNTGEVIWNTPRVVEVSRKFSFSTPTLIEVNGQKQVVSPGSGAVCAYDPSSGEEIWRVDYDEGYSVIPKPVFAHGLVYVCSGYGRPILFAIRPDGKGDVTDTHVAWQTDRYAPHTPSPLVVGDELYMVSDKGIASCLNARTGEVHWSRERLAGGFSSSPVFGDGKIFFQNEEGETTVIAPSKTFEKLASNSLGERTLASYGVVDEALLIRTEEHLYRIEAR